MTYNTHIEQYLTYYSGMKNPPRYAVSLTGAWGVGKTHFVKNLISRHNLEEACIYVSLYGISTTSQIDEKIIATLHPKVSKVATIGSQAVTSILAQFSIDIKIDEEIFFDKYQKAIFIFDDLERCTLPIVDLMGYINGFVEHQEKKVIVICNENEIKERDLFRVWKEKLVGISFDVNSSLASVFETFIRSFENTVLTEYLGRKRDLIEDVAKNANLKNLRILQQSLWDFERLYSVLEKRIRNHEELMHEITHLFFAYAFELKLGLILASDMEEELLLRSLIEGLNKVGEQNEAHERHRKFAKRHPAIGRIRPELSMSILKNILCNGYVDSDEIHSYVYSSQYFPDEEPSWKTVWYFSERGKREVEAAINDMMNKFNNREYTIPGEIFHVAGLQLHLVDCGHFQLSRGDVVNNFKIYLDDLNSQGGLKPFNISGPSDWAFTYAGLGMFEREKSEMREIYGYYKELTDKAENDSLPDKAISLLAELITDTESFCNKIAYREGVRQDETYYRTPILHLLPVDEFVLNFLKLSEYIQRHVARVLSDRYDANAIHCGVLAAESNWIRTFAHKIRDTTREESGIERCRIEWITTPLLNAIDKP